MTPVHFVPFHLIVIVFVVSCFSVLVRLFTFITAPIWLALLFARYTHTFSALKRQFRFSNSINRCDGGVFCCCFWRIWRKRKNLIIIRRKRNSTDWKHTPMQIISDFVCFCLFWHVDGFVGLLCYVRQKRKSYQIYACKKCFWLKHSYVPQVCCGGFDSMVKASLSNRNFQRNNKTELELALLYDCLYVVSLFLFIYLLIFPFIFFSLFLLLRLYILLV